LLNQAARTDSRKEELSTKNKTRRPRRAAPRFSVNRETTSWRIAAARRTRVATHEPELPLDEPELPLDEPELPLDEPELPSTSPSAAGRLPELRVVDFPVPLEVPDCVSNVRSQTTTSYHVVAQVRMPRQMLATVCIRSCVARETSRSSTSRRWSRRDRRRRRRACRSRKPPPNAPRTVLIQVGAVRRWSASERARSEPR